MFRSHTLRIVVLAAGILAFSASAAQASPMGLGYSGQSQTQSSSKGTRLTASQLHLTPSQLHGAQIMGYRAQSQSGGTGYAGTYRPTQNGSRVMSAAVDPANAQQVPVVVTPAQPVAASDSGFNWSAALLGAGIASVVLLLAGATASRIRPRRVAQF